MHQDQVGFVPGMKVWFNIHKSVSVIHQNNRMKDKSHIAISIDAEKAFDKMQHSSMIKMIKKNAQWVRYGYFSTMRAMYDRTTNGIILSGERLKIFL